MNVANRKLFANRDARQKLASMGGIMASSPELLGEAQKFAPGGRVTAEQYAVVIPGIADRPIRLNADTLARLQDLAPELMQRATVLDTQTAATQGIDVGKLRPGDLFVERRVTEAVGPRVSGGELADMLTNVPKQGVRDALSGQPIGSTRSLLGDLYEQPGILTDQDIDAEIGNLMPPKQPTLRDTIRAGLESSYSVGPGEALSNYLQSEDVSQLRDALSSRPGIRPSFPTPDEENPMVQLIESMVGGDEAAPEVQPELTVQRRTVDTPAFKDLQRQLAEQRTEVPGFNMPGEATTYEIDPTAALAAGESMSIGDQMLGLGFTGGNPEEQVSGTGPIGDALRAIGEYIPDQPTDQTVPSPDQISRERQAEIDSLIATISNAEATPGQRKAAQQRLQQIQKLEDIKAGATSALENVGEMVSERIAKDAANIYGTLGTGANLLGETDTASTLFDMQAESEAKIKKPSDTRARLESEAAAEEAAPEISQEPPKEEPVTTTTDAPTTAPETAAPGAADTSPLDTDEIVTTANNPDASPAERNKNTSAKVLGGLGVPNADKMGINERVSTYEKLFKEMLGEKDEDVAKEMWHNMAMIGFSIAAGESPNALKNIASGLLEGTKMMREDRATRRAREDKIGMLALEAGMADKRAEEKYARDVALAGIRASGTSPYEKMPTLQEAIDDAAKVEMSSAASLGKSMTYAEAIQKVTPAVTRLYTGQTVTATSDPDAENRAAAANALGLK